MANISVIVKHQGKKYDVELDPSTTGETFKMQLYSLTGVEPERQKILVKGGQLKDDTVLSSIGAKPGQTFMMMGTPAGDGPAPELIKPKEKIRFLEDMTEAEAAQSEGATPAGLQNLGNTCYLNSTIQVLRAVPELQEELVTYKAKPGPAQGIDLSQYGFAGASSSSVDLTGSLRDLYKQMSETQEGFPPLMFLHALQQVNPQFAERSRHGQGYAQQDAEEAWTTIVAQLRGNLQLAPATAEAGSTSTTPSAAFVDEYMSGRMSSTRTLTDAGATEGTEEPVTSDEKFLKLDCHIKITTNHLREGIMEGLSEKLTKQSSSLGRDAEYTIESRISRLPKYLTVHFVRFFWRRDINRKTKIMRKVTFPFELDATEFCAESLRKKLVPVRDKVREIRKDETDMERARKRQKLAHQQQQDREADVLDGAKAAETKPESSKDKPAPTTTNGTSKDDKTQPDEVFKTDAEYEAERASAIMAAKKELFAAIDPDLLKDSGSNQSGIYELIGVVTHQGASADSGHYTAYVKKSASRRAGDAYKKQSAEDDGKWWWFNDEKVSEVEADKIETLAGGGEAHSALILLYRAQDLPTAEEVKQ